ncbi:MAG: cell wall hydrolase [Sphingomonas sp.]|uniref:cell wall hydrolase n=1 Tax=Sphingomonas sp. TaxID=28214 RepID=UPI001ACA2462|nr:cell wall hydrolase [Sphingomonas sp.]MBN8814152.1 cell wall hydrolase [Sphingomonas sp.]
MPTRRELWLVATILLVIMGSLLVQRDVAQRFGFPHRNTPAATLPVPPSADEIRTLLTNTPLAITSTDAVALNAARPLDSTPTSFARPFFLPAAIEPPGGTNAALDCLTKAIYYEAASESDTGKRAVAQVVLNRMRSPIFPHSVCGVVFQGSEQRTGCQFSFTCDGSLARQPSIAGWASARRIALAALSGAVERSVGLSTHYHANYVVPYWAGSLDKVATIGAHIFYTMRGGLGRPAGFGERYNASAEVLPTLLPEIDPNADPDAELVGVGRSGETTDPLGVLSPNRTLVKDDLLGKPKLPDAPGAAPPPVLRADEKRGELVVDKTKGALKDSR